MTTTVIPGLKADHQMITPVCRQNRGTTPAFLEASERLQRSYDNYARSEGSENVTWHLVLVREEAHDSGPGRLVPPHGSGPDNQ